MAYTVAVTWIAKPGEEDAVASALEALVEPSRAEEGVLVYIPNRDPEDPTKFFIYEQYVDEAAYTAHTETEQFKQWGFGDAIPRLLDRKRECYAPRTHCPTRRRARAARAASHPGSVRGDAQACARRRRPSRRGAGAE